MFLSDRNNTLFEKFWKSHAILPLKNTTALVRRRSQVKMSASSSLEFRTKVTVLPSGETAGVESPCVPCGGVVRGLGKAPGAGARAVRGKWFWPGAAPTSG